MLEHLTPSARARFFSKLDPDNRWGAGIDRDGYGKFWLNGRTIKAHRVAWMIANDSNVPEGLWVLHNCPDGDDPTCCDAAHLYVGTHRDNMRDMVIKGRQATGDRHMSRLHPERLSRGDRHMSRTHPESLIRGDKHFSRAHPERLARGDANGSRTHPERLMRGERNSSAKLTRTQVAEIKRRYTGTRGELSAFAREYGVTYQSISAIVRGETWIHVA